MKKKNPIPSSLKFAALATDTVCFRIANGTLEILLGKINAPHNTFNGKWAHIGGLIQVDETAEDAVDRLLKDKAGIRHIYKEQLYTFSAIDRDPRGRVVSVAYIALTHGDNIQHDGGVETIWRPIESVSGLGYDHDKISRVALERLRSKILYTDIARHFMQKEFTLSQLQAVYEAVLGQGMDKRNFRKKILSLEVLRDTKRTLKQGVMRPATLYSFK